MVKTEKMWGGVSAALVKMLVFWGVFPTVIASALLLSPYKALAMSAYFLMLFGVAYRSDKVLHRRLMGGAMGLDVLLVLILEVQRSAVETAVGATLTAPQGAHIVFSLLAVLLYAPVTYLGFLRFHGKASPTRQAAHRTLGLAAFAMRSLGFIFMFFMNG